jgi:hypothetical protein
VRVDEIESVTISMSAGDRLSLILASLLSPLFLVQLLSTILDGWSYLSEISSVYGAARKRCKQTIRNYIKRGRIRGTARNRIQTKQPRVNRSRATIKHLNSNPYLFLVATPFLVYQHCNNGQRKLSLWRCHF